MRDAFDEILSDIIADEDNSEFNVQYFRPVYLKRMMDISKSEASRAVSEREAEIVRIVNAQRITGVAMRGNEYETDYTDKVCNDIIASITDGKA